MCWPGGKVLYQLAGALLYGPRTSEREQLHRLTVKTFNQFFVTRVKECLDCSQFEAEAITELGVLVIDDEKHSLIRLANLASHKVSRPGISSSVPIAFLI